MYQLVAEMTLDFKYENNSFSCFLYLTSTMLKQIQVCPEVFLIREAASFILYSIFFSANLCHILPMSECFDVRNEF